MQGNIDYSLMNETEGLLKYLPRPKNHTSRPLEESGSKVYFDSRSMSGMKMSRSLDGNQSSANKRVFIIKKKVEIPTVENLKSTLSRIISKKVKATDNLLSKKTSGHISEDLMEPKILSKPTQSPRNQEKISTPNNKGTTGYLISIGSTVNDQGMSPGNLIQYSSSKFDHSESRIQSQSARQKSPPFVPFVKIDSDETNQFSNDFYITKGVDRMKAIDLKLQFNRRQVVKFDAGWKAEQWSSLNSLVTGYSRLSKQHRQVASRVKVTGKEKESDDYMTLMLKEHQKEKDDRSRLLTKTFNAAKYELVPYRLPCSRSNYSVAMIPGISTGQPRFVIYGGLGVDIFNDCYSYSPSESRMDKWKAVSFSNVLCKHKLQGHAMDSVSKSHFIVYGGQSISHQMGNYIFMMNTETNTIQTLYADAMSKGIDDIPAARKYHSAVFSHNTLIIIGGQDANENVLGDIWRFDLSRF